MGGGCVKDSGRRLEDGKSYPTKSGKELGDELTLGSEGFE